MKQANKSGLSSSVANTVLSLCQASYTVKCRPSSGSARPLRPPLPSEEARSLCVRNAHFYTSVRSGPRGHVFGVNSLTAGGPAQESLKRHQYLNSLFPHENSTAFYGINQFSYLFPEEFKAIYLRSKPSRAPRYSAEVRTSIPSTSLPLRFDWREKHVVTQVRNQQTCGGCWAFSVVGAVESAWAIRGEPLEDLSAQQVIDCSYNNFGCNGGSPLSALSWLNKTRVKLVRDSEYPFKAQNGLCRYFSSSQPGFSIRDYVAYDFSDQEDAMAQALLLSGPLVVIVDAVSWQDYLGGVIQHHCSSGKANHAVLVTGFDQTGSTPYWIVRNSWGSSWGAEGYAYVKMRNNTCGIADSVSAVFV
ncbi:PREDICTED: cathepsin O isoform X2 [Chinchilla lanigera]|uniref:cathepsin O isoform X2 n=1 Tax=Chinchilla lanigera TaxID=34839 RepID=UPI00038EB59E|nr:PREDICTED: cathepsin O isoform X2 [Chinchilla lanigera]